MLLAQERVVEAGLVAAAPNNRVVVTDAAAPPNTFWEGFNAARQIDPVSTVWGKLESISRPNTLTFFSSRTG